MKNFATGISSLAFAFLAIVSAGCSPHDIHGNPHAKSAPSVSANPHSKPAEPTTYRLADDGSQWKKSPQMRAFYDASVEMLGPGAKADVDAYEAKSFAIFREFARVNNIPEAAMIDHLKLIPRQVVRIVEDDPSVLKSYDAFWIAMVGPD